MTVLDDTPVSKNLISPVGFKMVLKRAPNLEYWINKAPIPGIELGLAQAPNPFLTISYPGDHMHWEEFEVIFSVDENIMNYLEIFNWLVALGKPDSFKEYAGIAANTSPSPYGISSDITILVDDVKRNVNFEIVYADAFPVALSGITFDSTMEDIVYQKAEVRFNYRRFFINKVA